MGEQATGFNPRAHAGRDALDWPLVLRSFRFNPRAHAGRDVVQLAFRLDVDTVSIHAPTQGATAKTIAADAISDIVSIHAPTQGATCF